MGRTDIIKYAVDALQAGEVIAFPTDTVYGLGANAYNDYAIDKIYRIKRRSRDKPLILFIKNKAELPQYVAELTEATLSLVEKYWPGPLTLIFKAKPSTPCQTVTHTIGIRIPDHQLVLTLLERLDFPLATTSANIEGEPPLGEPEQIRSQLGIRVVLGDEKITMGVPSTILDVTTVPPTLLRTGKLKPGILWQNLKHLKICDKLHLLFVCTGNRTRSVIAEWLARTIFPDLVEVRSAGILPGGAPPDPKAVMVMREKGIDISSHRSSPVDVDLLQWADFIFVMEYRHVEFITHLYPDALPYVFYLDTLSKEVGEIPDPIGSPIENYQLVRDIIEMRLIELSQYLLFK